MTTNYREGGARALPQASGARPGLTMDAETEAQDRRTRLTPSKSVPTAALLRAYAELDAERAAHAQTLAVLADCADALEREARAQAPHPGALNPDLWGPAFAARAAIAAARQAEGTRGRK